MGEEGGERGRGKARQGGGGGGWLEEGKGEEEEEGWNRTRTTATATAATLNSQTMRLRTCVVPLLFAALSQALSSLPKCFEVARSRALAVAPKKLIPKITLSACQMICLASTNFHCRLVPPGQTRLSFSESHRHRLYYSSITYVEKSATCLLFSTDHFHNKIVSNPMSDYYHRTCGNASGIFCFS